MRDGYNGFLFGESPNEIVSAINKCFESGHTLRDNALKTLENYSYEAYKQNLHKLYEDVIARHKQLSESSEKE